MTFRETFFSNFMLKVSRYGEFNDPFDLNIGDYEASLSEKDAEEFYNLKPDHYKTADYYFETDQEIEIGARASVAILCFSGAFNSIPMWSHYAQNHTGVCVGYDADCDVFNTKYDCEYSDNIGELRPVEYTNERPKFILKSDLINDTSDWFKKSVDWSYEKEHRILLPMSRAKILGTKPKCILDYNKEVMWGFNIEPTNIKNIIMGCRMKESDKQCIREATKSFDIEIIEAHTDPSYYKLNF